MPIGTRIDAETLTGDVPESPAESPHKVSRVPVFQTQSPQYTFQDIILNHSTYEAIQDVLALYEKKDLLFVEWGLEATHKMQNRAGINLYGSPGTGKSMAAQAIANQLGRTILTVDYSQIESKFVGETAKNLVSMFDYAKESGAVYLQPFQTSLQIDLILSPGMRPYMIKSVRAFPQERHNTLRQCCQ